MKMTLYKTLTEAKFRSIKGNPRQEQEKKKVVGVVGGLVLGLVHEMEVCVM